MNKIEKIREEIERGIEETRKKYNDDVYHMGRCDGYSEILNFINALEEEQTDFEELDEAAEEYAEHNYEEFEELCWDYGEEYIDVVNDKENVRKAFKSGAKWVLENKEG